ncbi:hypothetical protein STXM2123_978 [Streptomyces sp. F-3]|nr:hypothetical protein STXM2123_978 [Streptomyces sp. F-3]
MISANAMATNSTRSSRLSFVSLTCDGRALPHRNRVAPEKRWP